MAEGEGDRVRSARASGYSASDLISRDLFHAIAGLASTKKAPTYAAKSSHHSRRRPSPMFTFDKTTALHKKFVEFYEKARSPVRSVTASRSSNTPNCRTANISPRVRPSRGLPTSRKTSRITQYGQ